MAGFVKLGDILLSDFKLNTWDLFKEKRFLRQITFSYLAFSVLYHQIGSDFLTTITNFIGLIQITIPHI